MKPDEILNRLFGEGDYTELNAVSGEGEGVITVAGEADENAGGALIYAFAQQKENNAGAISTLTSIKLKKLFKLAAENGAPLVGFFDGAGGDLKDGANLINAYSDIFTANAKLSGVVPRIAVISGVAAGLSAVLAETFDFVLTYNQSEYFFVPPSLDIAKSTENIQGAIHYTTLEEAIDGAKKLLSLLPLNNLGGGVYLESKENFTPVSDCLKGADLLSALSGMDTFIELYGDGGNAAVGFGAVNFTTVAFVYVGSSLSSRDANKIAKFVSFADNFNIPVVTVYDTDGFTTDSIKTGVKSAARLALAYNSATTAKINVILKKAYGGAYLATAKADITIALKNSVISPVSPKTFAVLENGSENIDINAEKFATENASPVVAAKSGLVDIITDELGLKDQINMAISLTQNKRVNAPHRKHINFVF